MIIVSKHTVTVYCNLRKSCTDIQEHAGASVYGFLLWFLNITRILLGQVYSLALRMIKQQAPVTTESLMSTEGR